MMLKSEKILKLQIKNGDLSKEILAIFSKDEWKKIYFLIPRDFLLITESIFLKKIKIAAKKYQTEIFFVTQKNYFSQILKAEKFKVLEAIPEEYKSIKIQKLKSFSAKIEAKKNPFTNKKIEFKTKITGSAPNFSTRKIENLKDEKSVRGIYFFGFFGIIFLLACLFFWISPRAEIEIKPKVSVIPVTQNILVTLHDSEIKEENKDLPKVFGIYIETEIEESEYFPSTKKTYDLTHAKGKVTIFNETNETKFFVPSRLSTVDGLIFRTQKNIEVPPKKNGKPGRLVVEIIADAYDKKELPIGNRGNIDAGTELFFPGLRKESQELYYARANKGPLVGGSTLTHYFVDENDFELAKPILKESFRIKGIENLQKELKNRGNREGKKYILLDENELLKSELIDFNVDKSLIGKEQQTFMTKGKVKVSGIVFDQDSVLEHLTKKIQTTQDHRKKLLRVDENSLKYRVIENSHQEDEKWVKLSVSLMGIETLDLNAKNDFTKNWYRDLKKEILGKSRQQIRGILTNHAEIEEVFNIKISPFWVKKMPKILEQIDLKIKY